MVNPFFDRSTLPAELPPFADIRAEDYEPAFERGMADQLIEVAAIIEQQAEPDFENTIAALERSGSLLARVAAAFFTLASADGTEFVRELEARLAPRLTAHEDAIRLNSTLFSRVAAVADDDESLDAEQRWLVERYRTEFTLAGAALDDAGKDQLRAINSMLSELTTAFDSHLVADTNELAVHVTDESELEGLSPDDVAAAAGAAAARGLPGHLITLVLPTGHPALASLTHRDLRERIMRASLARGTRGEHDNRGRLLEIVRLRARRAELLGFPMHAAVVTADETARTPEAVHAMLLRLAVPAASNADVEASLLQQRLTADGIDGPLRSWDWAYYSEAERAARYDVDEAALRPYLEVERVLRDGVFFAATRLYGVTFAERPDLVGYHPDVRVFEVHDDDDALLGLYLLDLYTRDTKRGGAWMNSLVDQSRLTDTPYRVVINNLNVPKPPSGEPTLLTLDLTTTLFHEFGHALHGLFATVGYPKLAGTNVPRDFVEFPSQVNEQWVLHPEVLANYAVHVRTGEPLPVETAERLRTAAGFNEGFATSEYLAAATLDQAWHRLSTAEADAITDVGAFEAAALTQAGLANPAVPTRYSSAYFAHVFAGGYSAAYYAYIWSEVLDADTVAWFQEHGGLTRENGDRFRQRLLGVGGSADPLVAYREFRGGDAAIEPLLVRRGLTP